MTEESKDALNNLVMGKARMEDEIASSIIASFLDIECNSKLYI